MAKHYILDSFDYDDEKLPLLTVACGASKLSLNEHYDATWHHNRVTCKGCIASWLYIEEEIKYSYE